MADSITYDRGDQVRHARFGSGRVELDAGITAIVRFEHGIEECSKSDLESLATPLQALHKPTWDSPLEVLTKVQGITIEAINDAWGIFSRSRIALLPHQLWVCRRVLEKWPTRWLVADDVGLGKTIEAGLILWPLLSRKRVKRLLILTPAKLVEQWQYRLRTMFDIRVSRYLPEADNERSDFWGTHNQVVASFHTLRDDRNGRHQRLVESDPWDLVIVDEAHHLNADEKSGPTLGYRLVDRLMNERRIESMVFFTGTPHRGKNYGFLALARLLRPDLFDPEEDYINQLQHLPSMMIRNNKQNVTDIKGNRLFQTPNVMSEEYTYSEAEDKFYRMLTSFIVSGRAYASGLESNTGRAVMLVLITMQKLASSSVAAVRRALTNRLNRTVITRREVVELEREYELTEAEDNQDRRAEIEEVFVEKVAQLKLMEDEEDRIRELLEAAEVVGEETKMSTLIEVLQTRFEGRAVLFFTEYKATQSLLMSALIKHFGDGCVGFINGDNRAEGVVDISGNVRAFSDTRDKTAERFNRGEIRFLVSTEAGGEGIDLQEKCHTLVHVDLPWNPMRLHQRVGRLNRYGQQHKVDVMSLRNPDTVESRIWDKLNLKIDNIMQALQRVMDDPEDLFQLVLGMTPQSLFTEVFSDSGSVTPESLEDWFDKKTAQFGGQDVIETVEELFGNCSRFDYQSVSDLLPKLDLPDLETFLVNTLTLNNRRVRKTEGGLSFRTPKNWMDEPGMFSTYEAMIFDRNDRSEDAGERILGIGHKVIDLAVRQFKSLEASVTVLPSGVLSDPLVVFQIGDRITTEGGTIRKIMTGVVFDIEKRRPQLLLKDWEMLKQVNSMSKRSGVRRMSSSLAPESSSVVGTAINDCREYVESQLNVLGVRFSVPEVEVMAVLWPGEATSRQNQMAEEDCGILNE
jgi:ERCC4-related helicase